MLADPSTVRALPQGVTLANPWSRLAAFVLEDVLFIATLGIGWIIWAAIIAGNEASDDRVEMATLCGGSIARAKRASGTPPKIAAIG